MKKKILYIIIIIIIGYSVYHYQDTKALNSIETQIEETNKIDFSKIDYFDWDELLILKPYQKINDIEKKYKVNLINADNSIEIYDKINSIIFLKNKQLIKQVNLSNKSGEIVFDNNPIKKESAIFILKKMKIKGYKNLYLKRFIQQTTK